jgi:hypothetical protein
VEGRNAAAVGNCSLFLAIEASQSDNESSDVFLGCPSFPLDPRRSQRHLNLWNSLPQDHMTHWTINSAQNTVQTVLES